MIALKIVIRRDGEEGCPKAEGKKTCLRGGGGVGEGGKPPGGKATCKM